MIGQTLGHYAVIEKVGAGGMGEVYRARDQHLERDVRDQGATVGVVTGRRHPKALSPRGTWRSPSMNHPNIATVFDFDTQNGVDFLVMELIDGIRTERQGSGWPSRGKQRFSEIGAQLAAGLAAAHAEGVVHRNLKPGNLMIADRWPAEDSRLRAGGPVAG